MFKPENQLKNGHLPVTYDDTLYRLHVDKMWICHSASISDAIIQNVYRYPDGTARQMANFYTQFYRSKIRRAENRPWASLDDSLQRKQESNTLNLRNIANAK